LRVGKLWRFRASQINGWPDNSKQITIDSHSGQRYSVPNHSCP
jgi:hypothetical protein